jgi:hypothetical protein
VVNFYIGKQKVVWILKLRENGWETAASALRDKGVGVMTFAVTIWRNTSS